MSDSKATKLCKFGTTCTVPKCAFSHYHPIAGGKGKGKPSKKVVLLKQPKLPVAHQVMVAHSIMSRISDLKRTADVSKAGYFDIKTVDIKKVDGDLKFLSDQLAAARGTIRDVLGNKPFRTQIYGVADCPVTVTTGTITTVIGIQSSISAENASFAAVFDEYRITGGKYHYIIYQCQVGSGTLGFYVVAYDPVDSVALTSIYDGCSKSQRHLVSLPVQQAGATATVATGPTAVKHCFAWRVPPGITIANSNAGGAGAWQPTTTTTINWGTLKNYCAPANPFITTALVGVSGILEMDIEFRIRE
jgi:hypothetical protein